MDDCEFQCESAMLSAFGKFYSEAGLMKSIKQYRVLVNTRKEMFC